MPSPLEFRLSCLTFEIECHKLGIPARTRHNEVAPNQFELAPIFEETNLANDHNLLLMKVMDDVARRHNFRVLLHEKPFAGINGSGKHNNWSLGTDTGTLLFAPGKTPRENLRFITFFAIVMAAVHRHNGLLKASIASATNAHRLGANEAPPAIISIFTGSQIADILTRLENSTNDELITFSGKEGIDMGVAQIPEIMVDNTDRNRTSPFAFTGNRFEFRAVGSSANCASAMIALNAAVAEQLADFKKKVDERVDREESLYHAILEEVKALIIQSKNIHFDGNGYSDEWKAEAERRGLDCETSVPVIFDAYLRKESVEMFEKTGVFTEFELKARNEVKWETYTKKVQIESRVLGDLALNHVVPVATRYQSVLVDNLVKLKTLFPIEKGNALTARDLATIEKDVAAHVRNQGRDGAHDQRPQRSQPHRRRTHKGSGLSRQCGSGNGAHPLSYRQTRTDGGQRNVASPQISRDVVYQIITNRATYYPKYNSGARQIGLLYISDIFFRWNLSSMNAALP